MNGKKRHTPTKPMSIGPIVQILASVIFSLLLTGAVMRLNESGVAVKKVEHAAAVLMLLPLSLIVALAFALTLAPKRGSDRDTKHPLETGLVMRIYWLMWAYFWVCASIMAYVF